MKNLNFILILAISLFAVQITLANVKTNISLNENDYRTEFELQEHNTSFVINGHVIDVDITQQGSQLLFTIENIGGDMLVPENWNVIEDDILLMTGQYNLNAQNGNELVIPVDIEGSSYQLDLDGGTDFGSSYVFHVEDLDSNNDNAIELTNPTDFIALNNIELNESRRIYKEKINVVAFPNPFSSSITFSTDEKFVEDLNVKIYDLNGRIVDQIDGSGTMITYENNSLDKGLYIFEIFDGNSKIKQGKINKE